MRIMHTADWHIGKQLNHYRLVDEQWDAFNQLKQIAQTEHVDAIVIAGDVYDRSLASEDTVKMVNEMMAELNLHLHYPLLVISGNHDSAERLGIGRQWFADKQFYLKTQLAEAFTPVVLADTQFFLLPYFTPHDAQLYFHDDTLKTMGQAMARITATMQKQFLPDKRHLLVAHFFASGEQTTSTEVGGLNAVPLPTMAMFDQVMLGHLHSARALLNDKIKYSGTLMPFTVNAVNQAKGVRIFDTNTGTNTFHTIQPLHRINVLTGSFADLIQQPPALPVDDFVAFQLTDQQPIPDLMNKLRQAYAKQRVLSVQRQNGLQSDLNQVEHTVDVQKLTPMELLDGFYHDVMQQPLTAVQRQLAQQCLDETLKEEK